MARTILMRDEGGEHRATVDDKGTVSIDGVAIPVMPTAGGIVRIGEDPTRTAWVATAGDVRWVYLDGDVFEIQVIRTGSRRQSAAGPGVLSAPMPATVVRVDVSPGARVRRGDTLIILEAMKMELPIRTPADGTVKAIHCRPGDLVQPGVALVDLE